MTTGTAGHPHSGQQAAHSSDVAQVPDPDHVRGQFRTVMGRFPTGVAIITGTTDGGPTGLTIQSFMALSIDPPLILISVDRKSQSWPKIHAHGRFAVNILSSAQQDIALQFARVPEATNSPMSHVTAARLRGRRCSEGAQAWIECEIQDVFDGGDHEIVTAAVLSLDCDPDPASHPLLFARSNFTRIDIEHWAGTSSDVGAATK